MNNVNEHQKTPKLQSAFQTERVFLSWAWPSESIGARTSQGAATGTWLRGHDEVSTVQNLAWIIYKMGN